MKFRSNAQPRTPGRQMRMPGQDRNRDSLVGRNGELQGWNKADLMNSLATLITASADGSLDTSDAQPERISPEQKMQTVTAAYADRSSSSAWPVLGSSMANEITEAQDRQGFMRRLMLKSDVTQGNAPKLRVRKKNVTALLMSGPGQIMPQFLRDNYIFPPEFTIGANIRIENRELNQGSPDLMDEKYYEALEAIMVGEDRRWKALADATVGVEHQLKYLVGGLNPTSFVEMRTELSRYLVNPANVVMSSDFWNDINGNTAFSAWFDPVTKYEIVTTGELGSMLGLTFITDGFRQENLKVLSSGEFYVVGQADQHGGYTDRGPVNSNEVNSYNDGVPARGWFLFEDISMALGNARSVIKGIRS